MQCGCTYTVFGCSTVRIASYRLSVNMYTLPTATKTAAKAMRIYKKRALILLL